MEIVGADIGKYKTKIKWRGGEHGHLSKIATYREIKDEVYLDQEHVIVEYEGKKYLAAELAEREGQNYLNSHDIYKSNIVTLLNLLIGLSRIPTNVFSVIVGNPFGINIQQERENLKKLIGGTKHFKINGKQFSIHIKNVGVAPEGLAAWYSNPEFESVNIFDFGSSTIHAIAIRNGKLLDKRSHTFDFGFESMVDHNYEELIHSIRIRMEKKWNDGVNKVLLVGGKAPEMLKHVKEQYPLSNATLHKKHEYANAIGLYKLGAVAYGETS